MNLTKQELDYIAEKVEEGISNRQIAKELWGRDSFESRIRRAKSEGLLEGDYKPQINFPKILTIDIETAPIKAYVWSIWQQNVGLNQIDTDWYILSFTAKWQHEDEIIYMDKRDSYDDEDDSGMLQVIWELLDTADVVQGQNSQKFDMKKINARFIQQGFKPPSHYKQVDSMLIAKRHFGFTSNRLEYLTDKLCTKYKKQKHKDFSGFELWNECLKGNQDAWFSMESYNKYDVLSTEELIHKLRPWANNYPNINVYNDEVSTSCSCGHDDWEHIGYHYTNLSKFDKFRCTNCYATQRGRVNLLSKIKRQSLKANVI